MRAQHDRGTKWQRTVLIVVFKIELECFHGLEDADLAEGNTKDKKRHPNFLWLFDSTVGWDSPTHPRQ